MAKYDYRYYDADSNTLYSRKLLEFLAINELPKNLKILDLGTGAGIFYNILKEWGFEDAHACDMVKTFPEVKVFDLEKKFKYPTSHFDLVISRDVIEHIKDNNNFISEIHRILKPGGKAIIMTPECSRVSLGEFFDTFSHYHPYTLRSLRQGLETYEFKEIEVFRVRAIPFLWKFTKKAFNYVWSKKYCNAVGIGIK